MSRADADFEHLLSSFFTAEVDSQLVDAIELSGAWPEETWKRLAALDLPWVGVPESAGGVGGTLADVVAMIHHAAYHAAPLPLLEHHLAAHMIAEAGLDHLEGPLTVAGFGQEPVPQVVDGRMTGSVARVPWGDAVSAIVTLTTDSDGRPVAAVLDGRSAPCQRARDLAGIPTSSYLLDNVPVLVGHLPDEARVRRRAEVLRCAAMAGMLSRLFHMTSTYAAERHQFGRPIGAFQGVQIHLVHLAQAAAMAGVAVDRAAAAVASGDGTLEAAATAVIVDEFAASAAAAAHQAHGAIGMTREYPLQKVTRRLHAWRQAWTPTSTVAEQLGRAAHAAPSFAGLVARHPEEQIGYPCPTQ